MLALANCLWETGHILGAVEIPRHVRRSVPDVLIGRSMTAYVYIIIIQAV